MMLAIFPTVSSWQSAGGRSAVLSRPACRVSAPVVALDYDSFHAVTTLIAEVADKPGKLDTAKAFNDFVAGTKPLVDAAVPEIQKAANAALPEIQKGVEEAKPVLAKTASELTPVLEQGAAIVGPVLKDGLFAAGTALGQVAVIAGKAGAELAVSAANSAVVEGSKALNDAAASNAAALPGDKKLLVDSVRRRSSPHAPHPCPDPREARPCSANAAGMPNAPGSLNAVCAGGLDARRGCQGGHAGCRGGHQNRDAVRAGGRRRSRQGRQQVRCPPSPRSLRSRPSLFSPTSAPHRGASHTPRLAGLPATRSATC